MYLRQNKKIHSSVFASILIALTLYLSQMVPYIHIHHSHEGEVSRLQISYHIEQTDFTNQSRDDHDHGHHHHDHEDHTDSDSHQHSFDDFISWHVIRAQNITHISYSSQYVLTVNSQFPILTAYSYNHYIDSDNIVFSQVLPTSIIRGPPHHTITSA